MNDLISRRTAIEVADAVWTVTGDKNVAKVWQQLKDLPSAQPERKKDIIQKFHDYQVELLKSHYDIEVEPQLEEMIVRFLHDTANCYMMEVEYGRPD